MNENPFNKFIAYIVEKHGEENWVTVYQNTPINGGDHDGGMYCALVSPDKADGALSQNGWDLMVGAGGPGFSTFHRKKKKITRYYTNADEGYLRLVLNRTFHDRKEDYIEILEEFRLFHNLYHDQKTSKYLTFDDAGDEVDVIKVTQNEVQIRRGYLRSFMAARQMHLLLYFELTKHFKDDMDFSADESNGILKYTIFSGKSYSKGYKSFARILGKKLIRCEAVEKCGIWPFEREKTFQDFVIDGDDDAPKIFTCNPDLLANYFGANPNAPHYLTPVFFRKEVMQKYYGSSEYEISDGCLSRRGAWSLRFDNNSPNHVSAFLGDLGNDLPEKEQVYWKSFNIFPDGRRISQTNFQRSFMGNFFGPENPEHKFKNKFIKLQRHWYGAYGWHLFLPLSEKDAHFFSSIHSMLTSEQAEFDAQMLALTKVTIDSLNTKELRKLLEVKDPELKSIALADMLLNKINASNGTCHIGLLRGIQSVRSTGVAHRKGTEYDKAIAKLDINENNYQAEFDQLLCGLVDLFDEILSCIVV